MKKIGSRMLNILTHEKLIYHNNYVSLILATAWKYHFHFHILWKIWIKNKLCETATSKIFHHISAALIIKRRQVLLVSTLMLIPDCPLVNYVIKHTFSKSLFEKKSNFLRLHFCLLGSSMTSLS